MSPAPGCFAPWLEELAPGISDPSRIARDLILYRSAEELPRRRPRFAGDSMSVELDDGFRVPIETNPPENQPEKPRKKALESEP